MASIKEILLNGVDSISLIRSDSSDCRFILRLVQRLIFY